VREQFLALLDPKTLLSIEQLNERLAGTRLAPSGVGTVVRALQARSKSS
jgi:hypothetical protein